MKNKKRTTDEPVCSVMPVSLLIRDRLCVVVGGGRIGCRKMVSLLEAGARVKVIALAASDQLKTLAAGDKRIEVLEKSFEESDVHGAFLVFAATGEVSVNRQVRDACARKGILCGVVDKGWETGDLISPAVVRQGIYTIAISSGGKDCRGSRVLKDQIIAMLNGTGKTEDV